MYDIFIGFMYHTPEMGFPVVGLHEETSITESQFDIAIIGGGPAGSTAALFLARKGFRTCVIEKHSFPRETLCGEFLSREVVRIIEDLHLTGEFQSLQPNPITAFRFCPEGARTFASDLKFTAYGLKRGSFDAMLLDQAWRAGATIFQPMTAVQIDKTENRYTLLLTGSEGTVHIRSRYVACAYGRSHHMDKTLQRNIPDGKSQLIGVKFHVQKKYFHNVPNNEIRIYTGRTMYCGINVVNDNTVTLCFLEDRSSADRHPRDTIKELMMFNPHFARLIPTDFIEALPSFPIYGTTGIYFGSKTKTENGMFMIGDAAHVIAPLAGDGIGMAMESAQLFASVMDKGRNENLSTDALLQLYAEQWRLSFRKRTVIAMKIQQLLFSKTGKKASGLMLSVFPSLLSYTIELTRGSHSGGSDISTEGVTTNLS